MANGNNGWTPPQSDLLQDEKGWTPPQGDAVDEAQKKTQSATTSTPSTEPVSQPAMPSEKSGEKDSEPISLPDSYQADRSNYKDLVAGGKYKLLRNGKPVVGTWDANAGKFIMPPLIDLTPQVKQPKGFVETVVETAIPAIGAAKSVENEEEVLSRASIDVDKVRTSAAEKISDIEYLSSFKPLQDFAELKRAYQATDDQSAKAAIGEKINEMASKKLSDKDFYGATLTSKEEKAYSQYMPAIRKDQQFMPVVGDIKAMPKTDKTVGELYNEVVENTDYVEQAKSEVAQWEGLLKQNLMSQLPEEKLAEIDKLELSEPEKDAAIQAALVEDGKVEDVFPALGYGLIGKLDALYTLGGNVGLSDDELIKKKLTDIRKMELFGKKMEGLPAEISNSVGGMIPDIAFGSIASPAMLASMMSTMPNDYLGQSIYDDYMNGRDIDVAKAKKYAAASTAAQGTMLMGMGKLGSHFKLMGKNPLVRSGELMYEMAKRGTKDALTFGVMGGYMQNKINEVYDLTENDDYLNSMLHMFIIGGMFAMKEGVGQVGKIKFPKKVQNEVDYLASYLPSNYTREQINNLVKGEVVMMSPQEYLQKVRDGFKGAKDEGIIDSKKEAINKAIDEGAKINMPFLSYKDGKSPLWLSFLLQPCRLPSVFSLAPLTCPCRRFCFRPSLFVVC